MGDYVYIIRGDLPANRVKIGIACDVDRRMRELQTANPGILSLVLAYQADSAKTNESYWHNTFQQFRKRGEWFSYCGALRKLAEALQQDMFKQRCFSIWACLADSQRRIVWHDLCGYSQEYKWVQHLFCGELGRAHALMTTILSIDTTVMHARGA